MRPLGGSGRPGRRRQPCYDVSLCGLRRAAHSRTGAAALGIGTDRAATGGPTEARRPQVPHQPAGACQPLGRQPQHAHKSVRRVQFAFAPPPLHEPPLPLPAPARSHLGNIVEGPRHASLLGIHRKIHARVRHQCHYTLEPACGQQPVFAPFPLHEPPVCPASPGVEGIVAGAVMCGVEMCVVGPATCVAL